MLLPLVNPDQQFCDANGVPMAGGTIDTFIPGTDTPKNVWVDLEQTALQTNPIVLDAAGRCLMYGAGDYRLVLKDASGNLIWDQETSAIDESTLVTMAEVNTAVQVETNRATAAESALTTANAAQTTSINALQTALNQQLGGNAFQCGLATTNSYGYGSASFSPPFSESPVVILTPYYGSARSISMVVESTHYDFNAWAADATGTGVAIGFFWLAYGPL